VAYEGSLFVHFAIGLGNDFALFHVRIEVLNLIRHAAFLNDAIRRFDEAELVYPRVDGKRIDETDVRTFRRLNRTNTTVVRGMNVANLKTGAFAIQTTWTQSRQTTLVRQFRQRIDLVHELRQLRTREEIANYRGQRLRIDQLLRRDRIDALIVKRHALTNETFGTSKTKATLISEQFANRAHTTAA